MADRELLELAAKAAGYKKYYSHYLGRDSFVTYEEAYYSDVKECQVTGEKTLDWNPLTDDGDALRLAVKLNLNVDLAYGDECVVRVFNETHFFKESAANNACAAARRAIVRAAAEIGKAMP